MSEPIEIDAQGLTAGEFEEILCDRCHNAPLTYYCPACDFKVCGDCIHRSFKRKRNALECRNCGHVDKKLDTFVGPDRL
ncbi:hypothetical protein ACFLQK_00335 [bacterium]